MDELERERERMDANKLANVRQSMIDDSSHDDDSYKLIRLHKSRVSDFRLSAVALAMVVS